MLNIFDLPDLLAKTLYSAECHHLPKLSRAEEQELITKARGGDENAKEALIISCLDYVLRIAIRVFLSRRPAHDEALDLAQTASVEMLAGLDKALMKNNPASYLRGIAARAMSIHLTYDGDIIQKPHYLSGEKLLKADIPMVESLDNRAFREGSTLRVDLVQAVDENQPKKQFAWLYEALQRLTPRQRNIIAKTFEVGEFDPDISVGTRPNNLDALIPLRRALTPYLTQIIEPEPEQEE